MLNKSRWPKKSPLAVTQIITTRVVYKFSCAGCSTCYVGETNRPLATRVREHLTSDKNSRIFQHINGSEACRALCSEDCFSIFDTASTSYQLKIKKALHIGWEKPSLNKQSCQFNTFIVIFLVRHPLFSHHCIFYCLTFTLLFN